MEMDLSLLHQMFHHLPEAVFVLKDTEILYRNATAQVLFPTDSLPPPFLFDYLTRHSGDVLIAHQDTIYLITTSAFGPHHLIMMRPQQDPPSMNFPSSIPALLRGHLSNLAITTEQLADLLSKEEHFSEYHTLLSLQTQAIYRILRLAKQMELSLNDWERNHPCSPLDLVSLCRSISAELASRTGGLASRFTFHPEAAFLLISGNKPLLEQLILAMISKAMKTAGPDGLVELSLTSRHGRIFLSVWNDGPAISEDGLLQLFLPQSTTGPPRPQEECALDLWLAHRIALFHGGVIMAGNRPKGGSEFVLSLPTTPPQNIHFESADHVPPEDGFSPVLIALSDALPPKAFNPLEP